jgi:hypothetical protein
VKTGSVENSLYQTSDRSTRPHRFSPAWRLGKVCRPTSQPSSAAPPAADGEEAGERRLIPRAVNGVGTAMAKLGMLRSLWLTRLSKPAGERTIYRQALTSPPRRILELGLGTLNRTERLLEVAGSAIPASDITYVGLDRFESRAPGDPPGVSLKEAHQRLHAKARVQLVPGNIDSALARVCNHLGVFDLVVISSANDERHLSRCWFFLQRVTTTQTTVIVESARGAWSLLSKSRIDEMAARAILQRAG